MPIVISKSELSDRLEDKLVERMMVDLTPADTWEGYPRYVLHPEQNVLPNIDFEGIRKELESGAGNELRSRKYKNKTVPPKFHAARSSAALAVNTFGLFHSSPRRLRLLGKNGFKNMQFEGSFPTGVPRSYAHPDVVLDEENGRVLIESKLLEPLGYTRKKLTSGHLKVIRRTGDEVWGKLAEDIYRCRLAFRYVDVAQLLKHWMGVRNHHDGYRVMILYVYWEPSDWNIFDHFREHRKELADLNERLHTAAIKFHAISYASIWEEMKRYEPEHVNRLEGRYGLCASKG